MTDVLADPCLAWTDKGGIRSVGSVAQILEALFRRNVSEIRVPFDVLGGLWSRLYCLAIAVTIDAGRDRIEGLDANTIAGLLRARADREGGAGAAAKAFRLTAPRHEFAFMQVAVLPSSAVNHDGWKPFTLKTLPEETANFRAFNDALPIGIGFPVFLSYGARAWGVNDQLKNLNQASVHVYVLPGGDLGARMLREIDICLDMVVADTRPIFGWLGVWPADHEGTKTADKFHPFALTPNDPTRLIEKDGLVWAERTPPTKAVKPLLASEGDEDAEEEQGSGDGDDGDGKKAKVNIRYLADMASPNPVPWTALGAKRESAALGWGVDRVASPGDMRGFSLSDVVSLLESAVDGPIEDAKGKRRFCASRHLTSKLPVPAHSLLVIEGFAYDGKGQKVLYPIGARLALPVVAEADSSSIWGLIRLKTKDMIDAADAEQKNLWVRAHRYFEVKRMVGKARGSGFLRDKVRLGKNAKKDIGAETNRVTGAFAREVDSLFFHELGFAITVEDLDKWKDRLKVASRRVLDDFCVDRANERAHLIARAAMERKAKMNGSNSAAQTSWEIKQEATSGALRKLVNNVFRLPSGDLAALRREHSEDRFAKVGRVCGLIGDTISAIRRDGGLSIDFDHAYELCVFMARVGYCGFVHPAKALRNVDYSKFDDLVCARGDRLPEMLTRAARILHSQQAAIDPYPIYRLIAENMGNSDSERTKIVWMQDFYASRLPATGDDEKPPAAS